MSDFFVNLGTNATARKLSGMLGVPLPQQLRRDREPWRERPLHDLAGVVGHDSVGELAEALAACLAGAGAEAFVVGAEPQQVPYRELGVAYGRRPTRLEVSESPEGLRPQGLVLDATGLRHPEELRRAWAFFKPRLRSLRRCGRALVLARPAQLDDPAAAATSHALEGFARSMARELGRKGSTAQVVFVQRGAEARLEPLLRFLLSARSVFISGQPFLVSADVAGAGRAPATRPLDGRVALVTGAAHGIGAATARAMAREGARVIVMDRPSEAEPAGLLADEIKGVALLEDITDPGAPQAMLDLLQERFDGRLDVLVHNAGVTRDKMLFNMDQERWDLVLQVNLLAVLRVNELLLPTMKTGGRVICTASIAGIAGNKGQCNYAASKAGVIGAVRATARQLAGRGGGGQRRGPRLRGDPHDRRHAHHDPRGGAPAGQPGPGRAAGRHRRGGHLPGQPRRRRALRAGGAGLRRQPHRCLRPPRSVP